MFYGVVRLFCFPLSINFIAFLGVSRLDKGTQKRDKKTIDEIVRIKQFQAK
jgi:hypothetical protein